MRGKSHMTHAFSRIPTANIPRSTFDRSCSHKTTFDSGYLVPIYVDEALPGDTFNLRMTSFARLLTPIVPFMDSLFLDTFFFAVPNRLLWTNWKKFNGEQTNPGDAINFLVPTIAAPAVTGFTVGSLSDYFGLPTGIPNLVVDSLWHRAYNLIFNEWFRSEDLQNSVTVDTGDGPDNIANYTLLRRGKRHDYFTSCLPYPQKGNTTVELPLGVSAPVYGDGKTLGIWDGANTGGLGTTGTGTTAGYPGLFNTNVGTAIPGGAMANASFGVVTSAQGNSGLYADLTNATAATINDLRQAFQIQKLLERDARGGTRYQEIIRSHFGVISPDSRMQRPEFLGGSTTPINVHPVPQTSETGATTPQGNLAAFATVVDQRAGFTKSFTEHCVIIGLINVRADLSYQQGLDRMFSRQTRYDFYWPALSHIGEQGVLNKEIYCQGPAVLNPDGTQVDDSVFGYQERYAEYRYKPSKITGKFRSTAAGTLDLWHLAQNFGALPTLNAAFIQDEPPVSRVVAVAGEPQFFIDTYCKIKCARPMPVYSVPGMIDHF